MPNYVRSSTHGNVLRISCDRWMRQLCRINLLGETFYDWFVPRNTLALHSTTPKYLPLVSLLTDSSGCVCNGNILGVSFFTVSICSSVLMRCLRLIYAYDVSRDKLTLSMVRRDSSVRMATRYGLESPDIESRWGARYSTPVQTGPGAHLASCTRVKVSFPREKRRRRGVDHPLPI